PADVALGVAPGSPYILRGPNIPGNATGASSYTPPPVYSFPPEFVPPSGSWPLPPVPVVAPQQPVQVPPFVAPLPYGLLSELISRGGLGAIANFPLSPGSDSRLQLRNVTFYMDTFGLEHVLGQVVNVSNSTAIGANVTA